MERFLDGRPNAAKLGRWTGERGCLARTFRRPRRKASSIAKLGGESKRKVRDGEAPSPACEAQALPKRYSARSATTGFTRLAFRAGKMHARSAAALRIATVVPRSIGL